MSKHIFDDVKTYELFYKVGNILAQKGVYFSLSDKRFDFNAPIGSFLQSKKEYWSAKELNIWLISDVNMLIVVKNATPYDGRPHSVTMVELVRNAIESTHSREELFHTVLVHRVIKGRNDTEVPCVYLYKISKSSQQKIQQIARLKQSAADKKKQLSDNLHSVKLELQTMSDHTKEVVFDEEGED